jgi:hypothetical protein
MTFEDNSDAIRVWGPESKADCITINNGDAERHVVSPQDRLRDRTIFALYY